MFFLPNDSRWWGTVRNRGKGRRKRSGKRGREGKNSSRLGFRKGERKGGEKPSIAVQLLICVLEGRTKLLERGKKKTTKKKSRNVAVKGGHSPRFGPNGMQNRHGASRTRKENLQCPTDRKKRSGPDKPHRKEGFSFHVQNTESHGDDFQGGCAGEEKGDMRCHRGNRLGRKRFWGNSGPRRFVSQELEKGGGGPTFPAERE